MEVESLAHPGVVPACQPWIPGVESVSVDLSWGQESLSKEGQIKNVNPEKMVIRWFGLWAAKGAATTFVHLHPQ